MHGSILIGTAKAANLLNVNRSTLTRLVASGDITPAMRLEGRGGALLFSPSDVLKLKGKRERGEK